jgi:hypothetical protein
MREERIFQRPSKAYQFPRNDEDKPKVRLKARPFVPLKSWPACMHDRWCEMTAYRSIPSLYDD